VQWCAGNEKAYSPVIVGEQNSNWLGLRQNVEEAAYGGSQMNRQRALDRSPTDQIVCVLRADDFHRIHWVCLRGQRAAGMIKS